MSGRGRPTPAFCEDADESDNIIEGTYRCAASSVASPTKEKPNTKKTRKDGRRDSTSPLTDSDSTEHPRGHYLKKSRDLDHHHSSKKDIIPRPAMRPPAKHARTAPSIPKRELEASYYGVSPTNTTMASSRPRAPTMDHRPASYYGNSSRPPPANARFYAGQPVPTPTSFPPPSWAAGGPAPYQPPASPGPVISQQPQHDYFSRPLEDRFSSSRPQSSMGFRNTRNSAQGEYDDDHVYDTTLTRRPSTHRRASKADEDRRAMPPPMRRPATARPTTLAYRPPPSTPAPVRRNSVFDEDDLRGDNGLFQDISPLHTYEYGPALQRTRSRRPSVGPTSMVYDAGDFRTEVAGRGNRRNSYYGNKSASSGSGYEDKLRQATIYQEETGGPPMQLTAETLRKAGRNGSSSRSTRSSGSHDESDYRRSATTRTTRSSNDEDVTIRVKGNATLKVGGAEMKCRDGTEININSRVMPSIRTVSDRSSYLDHDDRRPRIERPPTRARNHSQSGSFSRSLPQYEHPPLGYSPSYYQGSVPPYPAYPTFPQADDGFF